MVTFRNITAGETLNGRLCHASATAVSAVFAGPASQTLDFVKNGDEWDVSTETDSWLPGLYAWQLWITTAAGKTVGASGRMTVAASLANAEPGTDMRTTAQQNIEAIEAMLTGKASNPVKRYRINNRELESYSLTELLALLEYWKGIRRRGRRQRRRLGPNLRASL